MSATVQKAKMVNLVAKTGVIAAKFLPILKSQISTKTILTQV